MAPKDFRTGPLNLAKNWRSDGAVIGSVPEHQRQWLVVNILWVTPPNSASRVLLWLSCAEDSEDAISSQGFSEGNNRVPAPVSRVVDCG